MHENKQCIAFKFVNIVQYFCTVPHVALLLLPFSLENTVYAQPYYLPHLFKSTMYIPNLGLLEILEPLEKFLCGDGV